jgi:fatty acid desaturase
MGGGSGSAETWIRSDVEHHPAAVALGVALALVPGVFFGLWTRWSARHLKTREQLRAQSAGNRVAGRVLIWLMVIAPGAALQVQLFVGALAAWALCALAYVGYFLVRPWAPEERRQGGVSAQPAPRSAPPS